MFSDKMALVADPKEELQFSKVYKRKKLRENVNEVIMSNSEKKGYLECV